MKTCRNCNNLKEPVQNDDGSQEWPCSEYRHPGLKKGSSLDVSMSETEIDDTDGDCLNWKERESGAKAAGEADPIDVIELPRQAPSRAKEVNVADQKRSEYTPEELLAASDRHLERIKETNREVRELEDEKSVHSGAARRLTKDISEKRLVLDKLTNIADVYSFLDMEEEERKANSLPLIEAAEAAERRKLAWKNEPIDKFDLPEKDREKLLSHWKTCGEVSDWLSKDWVDKKEGCNGQAFRDRVRGAINKIEQDADVVLFVHRNRDESETELILEKQRNGRTGIIELDFIGPCVRFDEVKEPEPEKIEEFARYDEPWSF